MDSVAATQTPFFTLCKTLNSSSKSFYLLFHRHLSKTYLNRGFQNRFSNGRIKGNSHGGMKMSKVWFSISLAGTLLRNSTPTVRNSLRLACISSSAALGGGGGGDGSGGAVGRNGGNGGGDGSNGESGSKSLAGESEDGSALSPDVIILDVGGMSCGGCASSVKRILESQPLVSSATVNLTTETAIVWAAPEAQFAQNWKQHLGEKLASHLTSCGFKSNLRTRPLVAAITDLVLDPSPPSSSSQCPSAVDTLIQVEDTCLRVLFIHEMQQLNYREHLNFVAEFYASAIQNLHRALERKRDEKLSRLKDSGRELAVSWALCTVCLLGHASHLLGSNAPSWIHAFHSTGFHMSLSLITLLGPGRQLILDGLKSLWRRAPNMNTLVGLGALSSFTVSSVAALIPELGWKSFFEEPIMLLAFVLLGRNLEQRAKLKAASDMTGLLSILPKKARLVVDGNAEGSLLDVPCNSLSVGDKIVVLPGDRVPADGIVRAGRSTVDESSFTGEPLPVTKLPGAKVTAGSININGTLTVEVRRPGGETVMGDIVRLVEEAQNEKVPVQRLADKVAGHFTYGVMALSAVTFMFWNTFGSQLLPAIIQHGSPVSLALQLSCSVLVIACPCALGLATPTAVLVGTSLGATRGLLLRGGNILEKFASVDTIVFDKTGTLTVGRPIVTKVVVVEPVEDQSTRKGSSPRWSELEILRLAAGVESNTNHPIGKAILEAARAADCQNVKVMDGTFKEEPGSGAMAIIEQRKISVGTSGWLQRHGVSHDPFPCVVEFKNQSVVYIGVDGDLAGLIYFEDKIRSDAGQVVESLSKQGISIYMLSGDKKHTAEYVASVVGIHRDKVISGVKPDEKKKFVCELQKEKKVVAMVGDGINDAAALASSDIGIAMGGGVGAASEVSSVVLMGNRLSQLLDALELSRLTMKTIKQNLWWAFAYNIAGIPIAAGLLLPVTGTMLTPSIAGALMGLSSMGVMANSLFLRLKFDSKQKPMYTFSQHTNTSSHSDLIDQNDKSEKIYSAKWSSS